MSDGAASDQGHTGPPWIVGISFVVAFVLAFGIGANDVANSFATTVGSRTLTLFQACMFATFAEFSGAVLLGGEVVQTIQTSIVHADLYKDDPEELMLGMLTTLVSTAVWLLIATYLRLPVSGTHATVAGIIGFTLVAKGASSVNWWEMGRISLSWVLSPVLAGIVSVGTFVSISWAVLNKHHPFEAGLKFIPYIYGLTVGINIFPVTQQIMAAVGEAHPYLGNELCDQIGVCLESWLSTVVALSVGTVLGLIAAIFVRLVVVPQTRAHVLAQEIFSVEDEVELVTVTGPGAAGVTLMPSPSRDQLTPRHSMGSRRSTSGSLSSPAVFSADGAEYRHGGSGGSPLEKQAVQNHRAAKTNGHSGEPHHIDSYYRTASALSVLPENTEQTHNNDDDDDDRMGLIANVNSFDDDGDDDDEDENPSDGAPSPSKAVKFRNFCLACVPKPPPSRKESRFVSATRDAEDAQTEKLFTFLQVLTAVFGSFVHGANDVSNAIGPLALVLSIWMTGNVVSEGAIPVWILAFGGIGIVIGLAIWGRRVIQTLGSDLTALTPSRGFTIEFGSALTVLLASRVGIPVSTTHTKVGSVVAVGYWSNDGAVSWRLFGGIAVSWAVTIPIAGLLSALLFLALRGTL